MAIKSPICGKKNSLKSKKDFRLFKWIFTTPATEGQRLLDKRSLSKKEGGASPSAGGKKIALQ